jgi:hypothetical protein
MTRICNTTDDTLDNLFHEMKPHYQRFIHEIDNIPDSLDKEKTKAMLLWHLVNSNLQC